MRNLKVTVGSRNFEFFMYRGNVAVNVKFHGRAEPVGEEATQRWFKLSVTEQDRLRDYAWGTVHDCWWEDIRQELANYDVSSDGRQGGYLIFDKYDESYMLGLEEDAQREPCSICQSQHHPSALYDVAPEAHAAHEARLRHNTPPLPFPDAEWDVTCEYCKEYYYQHVGTTCPMLLGHKYTPHQYTGNALKELVRLDTAVETVHKRLVHDALQAWLDDTLTDIVLAVNEAGEDT